MEEQLKQLRLLLKSIYIYNSVLKDKVCEAYIRLLEALRENKGSEALLGSFSEFTGLLAQQAEMSRERIIGDPWSNHIAELVLYDENVFTRKAEYIAFENMSPGLLELAGHDLRVFQKVSSLGLQALGGAVADLLRESGADMDLTKAFTFISLFAGKEDVSEGAYNAFSGGCPAQANDSRMAVKLALFSAPDWGACLQLLADDARNNGCGIFRRYHAFRWAPGKGLMGIPFPDPVRLSDLISYEGQRDEVVENTRRFVEGLPANNVLLYGDRGTGKSSTVKALIHEFGRDGLRLVEVGREAFADLPYILEELRERAQRFIIFIDDLSFEEYETEYKNLKAAMEGGIQVQPENVLIYATSNRKHLVKETLRDRTASGIVPEGEIHPGDTLEEKISLADRFGVVVTFLRPDQKTYLKIVEGLAAKEGINLNREELHSLAIKWEMLHNGRSGRTARQFIMDLMGRTSLDDE